MTDAQLPSSRGATPSMVPMKRSLEDDHTPSVSSPLNPDASSKARPRPVAREQREKKDSLKKRESTAASSSSTSTAATRGITPEKAAKKQVAAQQPDSAAPSPIRYNHPLPREPIHYAVRDPVFVSHEPEPIFTSTGTELKRSLDHPENKKHYRYTHCVADPSFSFMRYYRCTDDKPYGPRMSFADSDKMMRFDDSAKIVANEKGWRMARANVCAREGSFYYEVKIVRGVPAEGSPVPPTYSPSQGPLPHIRMGWSRREAALDVPVGFDGYSYGLTDIRLEPMHKSRMSKYLDQEPATSETKASMSTSASSKKSKSKTKSKQATQATFSANDHAREGDVIGVEISLPSLSLHRKVLDGSYNPAVDITSGLETPVRSALDPIFEPSDASPNIVRDRFPVPYKGSVYFESMEYRASKAMEAYGDRGPHSKETPSPNHPDPTVRCLPHSHIKIYKNGLLIGTAFRNLMAFLPPASQNGPEKERGSGTSGGGGGGAGGSGSSTRREFDDGMTGYFPTVAAFHGGIAEVNFGPDFWFPPAGLETSSSKTTIPVTSDSDVAMQERGTEIPTNGTPDEALPDVEASHAEADLAHTDGGLTTAVPAEPREHISSEEAIMRGLDAPRTKLRPIGERYTEQIAEDILYDIIDEVDFFMQDGGEIVID